MTASVMYYTAEYREKQGGKEKKVPMFPAGDNEQA